MNSDDDFNNKSDVRSQKKLHILKISSLHLDLEIFFSFIKVGISKVYRVHSLDRDLANVSQT